MCATSVHILYNVHGICSRLTRQPIRSTKFEIWDNCYQRFLDRYTSEIYTALYQNLHFIRDGNHKKKFHLIVHGNCISNKQMGIKSPSGYQWFKNKLQFQKILNTNSEK